jgi:hypothetical protein
MRAVLIGDAAGDRPERLGRYGRDGRGVASNGASCVRVEPRSLGFARPRFGPCRAAKARAAGRQVPQSTGAADRATQEWFRGRRSRLERYAGRRPKSSAGRVIDCEEDRTLRAVLVGMLRELERGQKSNRYDSDRSDQV